MLTSLCFNFCLDAYSSCLGMTAGLYDLIVLTMRTVVMHVVRLPRTSTSHLRGAGTNSISNMTVIGQPKHRQQSILGKSKSSPGTSSMKVLQGVLGEMRFANGFL